MKLLFDQSLPAVLAERARARFPGSAHVREIALVEASDDAVRQYAAAEDFAIVSKDDDFLERALLDGFPPKVIRLRAESATVDTLLACFERVAETILAFDRDPETSVLELDLAARLGEGG